MSYGKTVLVSILACMAMLFLGVLTTVLLLAAHSGDFAVGATLRGVSELVLASTLLGWIVGSAWYFCRR